MGYFLQAAGLLHEGVGYERAFMKDRELKKKETGEMLIQEPSWGTPWHLSKLSPSDIEVQLEGVNANV